MKLSKATLKSFSSTDYTAEIELSGSHKAYLEGVKVARNIPSAEMVAGRKLGVIFFNENNPKEAVVVAVY